MVLAVNQGDPLQRSLDGLQPEIPPAGLAVARDVAVVAAASTRALRRGHLGALGPAGSSAAVADRRAATIGLPAHGQPVVSVAIARPARSERAPVRILAG